jgi:hypothetical protein
MVEAVNAEAEGDKLMSLTALACPLPPLTPTQAVCADGEGIR